MNRRVLALAALPFLAGVARGGFTDEQAVSLVNADRVRGPLGGETCAQFFYHYLKKDRDPALKPPPWLDVTLPAMLRHAVWRSEDGEVLNEAQLWQAPAAVLYEFFETTRRAFPKGVRGGEAAPLASLAKDYDDGFVRFNLALDRLQRARLEPSLGGRGRKVMTIFRRAIPEWKSIRGSPSDERVVASVMRIGALSCEAFDALSAPLPDRRP